MSSVVSQAFLFLLNVDKICHAVAILGFLNPVVIIHFLKTHAVLFKNIGWILFGISKDWRTAK
jgi:hypothetical protein|tara:strand:+ start:1238 stop:1426 length:189 start_codon:yes stop_codon:yes gene_type:complete